MTYGYISDLHERKAGTSGCTTAANRKPTGNPLGPGDSCYVDERPALRRCVPDVLRSPRRRRDHAEEHAVRDQRRGERPVRGRERRPRDARRPRPVATASRRRATTPRGRSASCRRTSRACSRTTSSSATPFDIEPQGASIYVHDNPAASDPAVRQLERDTAAMTNPLDVYSASPTRRSPNYQAGALEERVLHMQTADPLRLPTYTLFPKPDYFFSTTGAERQHQQRVRVRPRLLQPEHRRHLGRLRGQGGGGERRRRP